MTKKRCELAVPIVVDVELGRKGFAPAVNVQNTGSYVANLPKALLLDPVANSVQKAEFVLDEMLGLQHEYLPQLDTEA